MTKLSGSPHVSHSSEVTKVTTQFQIWPVQSVAIYTEQLVFVEDCYNLWCLLSGPVMCQA